MYVSQGKNSFAGGAGQIDFNPISAFTAVKRGWSEYVCLGTG